MRPSFCRTHALFVTSLLFYRFITQFFKAYQKNFLVLFKKYVLNVLFKEILW